MGHIVADFIDTGILTADIIKTGILESKNGKSWLNMSTGEFNFGDKVKYENGKFEIIVESSDGGNTSLGNELNNIDNKIDSAKNEAINSANNTLTTTISNYYTKDETNSQINIAKEAINLGVSSTYETKTNVASQVTSTLNSAKSYADTKKTEAISTASSDATSKANNALTSAKSYADTKKNEAISSANNTLNSTIANYYTKAQTDSQINVAKNAITQSVSSTYETKTNVTNKINGVNSSISSLQTRMNTAESKITDTAITNTVKQNFYTKTETDGKVTTVQNSMNSSITQLSNQIATKVDVNGVLSTIQQNPNSIQIGFNKISNALTIDSTGMIAKAQNGNKYFQLGYNGMIMYNPANGTHQWGKVAAINNKFTVASNGNSSGLSLGHHVNENYVEDILCDSNGVVTVQRQMNHGGIYNNTYGQINIRQSGQAGWEITGRSDSQSIKPGGANQGAIGSNTQFINQSWIANRYNPSSLEFKHLSHYVDDLECLKLVSEVQPARYFYKEYDEDGNDITTFTTRTSQLGLIYEDVRECSGRDLLTNEDDKAINDYNMSAILWGATRNINRRLNDVEYENVVLREENEELKAKANSLEQRLAKLEALLLGQE